MRKKSRSRRHAKTKRNQRSTISSAEDARCHQQNTISSAEDAEEIDKGDCVMDSDAEEIDKGDCVMDSDAEEIDKGDCVMDSDADEIDKGDCVTDSDADEIDKRSISFYLDSAVNHPGPIRKGFRLGYPSSETMIAESIGKNYIPLSSYTTNFVYHPAESMMDIFVDPIAESKFDIFLDPMGESIMDVFVDSMGEPIQHSSYMGIFRPLSFYFDPSVSFTGLKNFIPAPIDMPCNSSLSNSKSVAKVSKNNSFSTSASAGQMENAVSSKSKVSINSIPDKAVFSILSKLPVKSLKRFGCACKSWSILFQNTRFMTMYSKHFISRHGSDDHYHTFFLANHFGKDGNRYSNQSEFHLLEKGLKLDLPSRLQQSGDYTCILGSTSVNGIFCLGQNNSQLQYVLWHPLTEEFMVIPPSPTQLTPKHPKCMVARSGPRFHGFGFDQLRDDFKVIQYVSFVSHLYPHHTTSFFEIYSLNCNSWRVINMENHLSHWNYPIPFKGLEVYVDGVCHWLVEENINHRYTMTLLSFDLSDEVFLTTPIGDGAYPPHTSCVKCLAVLNGSIALISNSQDDIIFHIYILGELGVTESWIKLYTYGFFPSIQWPLIGFGKMGYIYVTKKDYEVAYVDLSQINKEILLRKDYEVADVDLSQIIKKSLLRKDYEVVYVDVGIAGGSYRSYSKFFGGLYKESLLTSN